MENYGGWKAPITIDPGGLTRTIEVISPSSAKILIAPTRLWGVDENLKSGNIVLPPRYTLHGCSQAAATFPSMLLVKEPGSVILSITDPESGAEQRIGVPMYGGRC